MKELSIQEKAQRYDRAIEIARYYYNDRAMPIGTNFKIEKMFPELIENEGEKIRRALIKSFENHDLRALIIPGFSAKDVIAWLEKQNSNVDNANKEYWRGYREGKQEILDKYAELKKQYELKWSEEDEMMCTIAINACEYANDEFESFNDNYEKAIMWLKSLKNLMKE